MESFLVELPDMKVLSISGPQRNEYLHGQITVDTKSFDSAHARIGAHCDFKGKMWSIFFLTQFEESYHLLMPSDSAEQSFIQFKKYGVFSKVDIQTLDSNWHVLGGAGQQLKHDLYALFPDLRDTHLSHCANEFGEVITFNDDNLRFLLTLNAMGYERMQKIASSYKIKTPNAWKMLEISAGIGLLASPCIAEFVPQMFNLQALNGIDFNKGCYMGQEVVARTKFLGKNKRALYILEANSSISADIEAGATLEKAIDENWRRGGTVVESASMDNKTLILAVLANDTEVGDVLRLKSSLDAFTVKALPYSLS
ncbi:tRNA-modifying protein YgfZ [Glaciecola sp. SC05]|uniref:tRNA-modifying protein YgfZ n=1 Tax=Glaciecola sp. SC05 TaxID=1987355 RepID=UPI0035298DC0